MGSGPRSQHTGSGRRARLWGNRTVVLIEAGAGMPRLVGRRIRWRHRLLARLLGFVLDEQIANGRSPDTSALRAVRARKLVDARTRQELADTWAAMLREARSGAVIGRMRVPVRRRALLGAATEVEELIRALTTPLPVPARGVALAQSLLSDGAGPLYNIDTTVTLNAALQEAIRRLDPATTLLPNGFDPATE